MAKKELPGISPESLDFIEKQVKKGKSRKFFIIYKGADIRTLVVFKKGPFGPKIVECKKAGFLGDSVCGIVTGSGQNITFLLAGTDEVAHAMSVDGSYEEAPLKVPKFRKFFLDNGLKLKPDFEIIRDPAALPGVDDDEPSETSETAAENGAPPESAATDDDAMAAFDARLKVVASAAVPFAKAGGEQGAAVMALLKQLQAQRAKGDHVAGMATLDEIEQLLKQGAEAASASPPKNSTAASFKSRLAEVVPQIKQATGTPAGDEAKQFAGQAAEAARNRQYDQANSLLDQAAAALRHGVAPIRGDADPLAIWRDAKEEVDAQIESLASVLQATGHPYLQKIANQGLPGMAQDPTKAYVGLQTSLFELNGATGQQRQAAATKVRQAVASYRSFLDGNAAIKICDSNPICGPTTIRKTLHDALNQLDALVEA